MIAAVVDAAFDTKSVDDAVAAIDPALPLEAPLIAAVDILRRRFADIWQLRTAVEMMQLSNGVKSMSERHRAPDLRGLARCSKPTGGRSAATRSKPRTCCAG